MTTWKVMVCGVDGRDDTVRDLIHRLSESWSDSREVTFSRAQLNIDELSDADAAVFVVSSSTSCDAIHDIVNQLEESRVSMLALLDQPALSENAYKFDGALIDSIDAPASHLAALLRGLLHRQDEIHHLLSESTIHRRFHGGLNGQITKMHDELQLAAMVQREFLPRETPVVHGVEFAALWKPSNYVSGDIYDLQRLDDDHIGVFVADAVGHGVPAALMTMVICRSLTTKIVTGGTSHILEPSEVLTRLNSEMIRRQAASTRFATATYAVVDCRSRTMKLASAGHPPPIRLIASRKSETLKSDGGLLGIFPDATYDQIEIELGLNDLVLFYTDGFEHAFPVCEDKTEAPKPSTTRYLSEFDLLAGCESATNMIHALTERIDDQAGSLHQRDDLTMVCVRAGTLALTTSESSSKTEKPVRHPVQTR